MKLVKNFAFAVVLVSALAVNTPAGEQDSPGYVPPPAPKVMTTSDEYPPVESDTNRDGGNTTDTSDYLLFEALAALLSLY
jgi:hypothetical protein